MPIVNKIDCRKEGSTHAYAFAPSMASEATTAGNMAVFEDISSQLGLSKDDPRYEDVLTIWWGDLKTKVQMLSMQGNGVDAEKTYDTY